MGWTKGEIVLAAFTELGIASYEYDLDPQELASAIRRLDSMIAEWTAKGIRIPYPLPNDMDDSLSTEQSGIPDTAADTVFTNLALRLAPSYGKTVSGDTRIVAKKGMTTLLSQYAKPQPQQFNSMVRGSGHKAHKRPFTQKPVNRLATGDDGYLDLQGALNDGTND